MFKLKNTKQNFWCEFTLGLNKVGCLKKTLLLAYEYFCIIIIEEGFKTENLLALWCATFRENKQGMYPVCKNVFLSKLLFHWLNARL